MLRHKRIDKRKYLIGIGWHHQRVEWQKVSRYESYRYLFIPWWIYGIAFSNIGTVGREQLITSVVMENQTGLLYSVERKSTKTQTEFVSEIKKLAQKGCQCY